MKSLSDQRKRVGQKFLSILHRTKKRYKGRRGDRAISLIEIMVTLLIIGLISSFVYMNFMPTLEDSKVKAAKTQMSNFKMMLNKYKLDNNNFPTTAQGLKALIEKPVTEPVPENYQSGGYLDAREVPNDPWGHPYVYEFPDPNNPDRFLLKSLGSDGKEGGEENSQDINAD